MESLNLMNNMTQRPPIQYYKCNGPHKAQERHLVQCYGYARPHYYKECPYRHNNAQPITTVVAANVPLCSGCGIDHLGIERECIAQVSLNVITCMQAKAITQELQKASDRTR